MKYKRWVTACLLTSLPAATVERNTVGEVEGCQSETLKWITQSMHRLFVMSLFAPLCYNHWFRVHTGQSYNYCLHSVILCPSPPPFALIEKNKLETWLKTLWYAAAVKIMCVLLSRIPWPILIKTWPSFRIIILGSNAKTKLFCLTTAECDCSTYSAKCKRGMIQKSTNQKVGGRYLLWLLCQMEIPSIGVWSGLINSGKWANVCICGEQTTAESLMTDRTNPSQIVWFFPICSNFKARLWNFWNHTRG